VRAKEVIEKARGEDIRKERFWSKKMVIRKVNKYSSALPFAIAFSLFLGEYGVKQHHYDKACN
jgi:hypothetical protein